MKGCIFVASMLHSITAVQIKDVQEHLGHLGGRPGLEAVREELMKLHEKKIDESDAAVIRGFLNDINRTTFEALYDDKHYAQKLIDDARDAVIKCNDDREDRFADKVGEAVFDAEELVDEARTNHSNCKNHPTTGQKELHRFREETCTRHNNRVKRYENCGTITDTEDSDSVYEWMRCLENFTTHHCDLYEVGREQCKNATEDHAESEEDCHKQQNDFEDAVCSLDAKILNACSKYEGCYDAARRAFYTIKATVKELEILFKAQMGALEQIMCFGNAIIENHTDYDHCESMTCVECTPNMDIDYTDPPPRVECDEALEQKPCDQDFLDTEYNNVWNNGTDPADLLAACKPCPPTCTHKVDNLVGASPALYTPSGHGTFGKWDAGSKSCAILASTHNNPALTASTAPNSVNDGFCCDALYGFMVANLARGMKDRMVNGQSNPESDWVRIINRSDGGLPIQECSIDPYWGSCSSDPYLTNAADDAAMEKLRAYLCKNAATCNYATTQAGGWIEDGRLPAVTIPAAGEWAALMECEAAEMYCDA